MGPILDLRAGLNIETTPDATFAWLPDWDSGCTVRCTSAIHVPSNHRGMGSITSHLRGSSVHSFIFGVADRSSRWPLPPPGWHIGQPYRRGLLPICQPGGG